MFKRRKNDPDVEAAAGHSHTTTSRGQDGRRKWPGSVEASMEDLHSAVQEYFGTTLFLFLGLGGIQTAGTALAASVSQDSTVSPNASMDRLLFLLYISTSVGLSLLVSAWMFYRVTGGLFNPNVSLALWIIGVISPIRFLLYSIAQFLGGITAAALVRAFTTPPLRVNTTLGEGVNLPQAVFLEMFITAALILSILMLGAEKHSATPFAPIGVGLMIFTSHLFAANLTGASMNTARSFGPAALTRFPDGHHWVYWVGPYLGSLLAVGFYSILKHFRYWRLNPDQASVSIEKSPEDPIERIKRIASPEDAQNPTT